MLLFVHPSVGVSDARSRVTIDYSCDITSVRELGVCDAQSTHHW